MIFKGEFIFNDEYLGNLVFDNKGLLRERERFESYSEWYICFFISNKSWDFRRVLKNYYNKKYFEFVIFN